MEWRGDTAEDLLREIPGVISQLQCNVVAEGFDRAEYLQLMSSEYAQTLEILVQRVEGMTERAQTLGHQDIFVYPILQVTELHQSMQALLLHINSLLTQLSLLCRNCTAVPANAIDCPDFPHLPIQWNGVRGRPRVTISREMVENFEELGFSFTQTENILGVTTQTLRNRRCEFQMSIGPTRYSEIDDAELDLVVADILTTTPEIGELFMIRALTSRGFKLQRWRIRSSISRVDPIGRACRQRRTIFWRQYNVQAPNSLW